MGEVVHRDFGRASCFSIRMPNTAEYSVIFTPEQVEVFKQKDRDFRTSDPRFVGYGGFIDDAEGKVNEYLKTVGIEGEVKRSNIPTSFPSLVETEFVFFCSVAAARKLRDDMAEVFKDYDITECARSVNVWKNFDLVQYPSLA